MAPGVREENKRRTREALLQHSRVLFAERGFAGTTVAEVASAAGVTERTFFRYFGSKEELILDDITADFPRLHEAIITRPESESPFIAVLHGLIEFTRSSGPTPVWLFLEGPPDSRLNRIPPAMSRLLADIEAVLTDAVFARIAGDAVGIEGDAARFDAAVIARAALGGSRTALIAHFSGSAPNRVDTATLVRRLTRAFELLDRGAR